MNKNRFKYMKMHWEEYMIHAMDLSPAEYGALMLLTGRYWMNGGPLPNDNRTLAGTTRQSVESWMEMRPRIERFFRAEGGMLVSDSIDRLLDEVRAGSEKQRQKQLKRWHFDGESWEDRVVVQMRKAASGDDPF